MVWGRSAAQAAAGLSPRGRDVGATGRPLLDERGVSAEMTRDWDRAGGGPRVADGAPRGHWKILTILSALRLRGLLATMTIEEAADGDVFLAYVEQALCPALHPGDVVVMDNL